MKIVIIIPTYNEGLVIGPLIKAVFNECKESRYSIQILIVDGQSTDNTADVVRGLKNEYRNLELLVETKKQGLGMAYIVGIRHAVEVLKADAFIEFDGDFQHDPKDIPRLIREFENGHDYVIGSRYVPGGSVPAHWALYRKLLSKFGSLFIRYMLRLPTRDNTSGLKLSRVKGFFEKLPLDEKTILSKRHAYKIHLLYEMIRNGAKVKEIPIAFLERESGSSKSSTEDIVESLGVVWKLYKQR